MGPVVGTTRCDPGAAPESRAAEWVGSCSTQAFAVTGCDSGLPVLTAILNMDYLPENDSAPHQYSHTMEPLSLIFLPIA